MGLRLIWSTGLTLIFGIWFPSLNRPRNHRHFQGKNHMHRNKERSLETLCLKAFSAGNRTWRVKKPSIPYLIVPVCKKCIPMWNQFVHPVPIWCLSSQPDFSLVGASVGTQPTNSAVEICCFNVLPYSQTDAERRTKQWWALMIGSNPETAICWTINPFADNPSRMPGLFCLFWNSHYSIFWFTQSMIASAKPIACFAL